MVSLASSDDGGHSWSNPYTASGIYGNWSRRIEFRALGRTRDRIYQLVMSDPVPWRVMDAYLYATPGYEPAERYASQMNKVA
jgi:hypothetical protein